MGIRLNGQTTGYVQIEAPATAADNTLKLPNGNGSNGQMLTTDGNGNLSFTTPASTDLITDPTPQLGGDLDVDGNDIVSTSNGDIDLDPNGSGQVVFKGNSTRGSGAVKLNCENNSHGILVKGPPHSAGANYTLTLPNDTGTSGQLLSTDGLGTTTWTTVNASPSYSATASGTIANGDTIIVNADGTVSAVSGNSATFGSAVQIEADSRFEVKAVYDSSNDKVVVFYREDQDHDAGMAVVGTITGNSISFGTAVEFVYGTSYLDVCFDSTNNKVVVAYYDANGGDGKARVGTVSGTSISFGTAVQFESGVTSHISAAYDESRQKVIIAYRDDNNNDAGTGVVGTVSGTSISFGTPVDFTTSNTVQINAVYDSTNQKTVIFYRDYSNNGRLVGIVVGGTGTTFSYGSYYNVTTTGTNFIKSVFDPDSGKIIVAYRDLADNDKGKVVVATLSGSALSYGTPVVFNNTTTAMINISYHEGVNRIAIIYEDFINNEAGKVVMGTVSGTTVTFDVTADTFLSTKLAEYNSIIYDPDQDRLAIFYTDNSAQSGAQPLNAKIYQPPSSNLTQENYIGIADGAYADTATATVQIVGSVDDAQSGLTPGQQYFVQNDGSLALTAGPVSVVAGTAVSATKLIVKG
jgi:hypothetical protein|tara:strand:- start:5318 stop:7222 length:1905 start_codon:yes stop_codon:yes gene_type:complete